MSREFHQFRGIQFRTIYGNLTKAEILRFRSHTQERFRWTQGSLTFDNLTLNLFLGFRLILFFGTSENARKIKSEIG